MKTVYSLIIAAIMLTSCADSKVIDGKTYEPYGWADAQEIKDPTIVYSVCWQNVVWDVLLSETFIVPIWLTGWQFYEPEYKKVEYREVVQQDSLFSNKYFNK